jgi:hypothetical protein
MAGKYLSVVHRLGHAGISTALPTDKNKTLTPDQAYSAPPTAVVLCMEKISGGSTSVSIAS